MKDSFRKTLVALGFVATAGIIGAAADVAVTVGSGTTIFAFTCFTTKVCPAAVTVNSAGTEIGTGAAPIRVDPTGTTTQPVSGTVTATGPLTDTQLRATPVPISGTITANAGTNLNTSALATSANLATLTGTKNAGAAASNSWLAGAVFNSTPLTLTDTQQASLQADANGYLKVNVAAGGASGGTSSTFAAAFPATGTAIGMSQGGNMVALTGTSNNLNVQCANCSGSGVSTADEATFTAGTSLFAGTGGFFQTTATNNALTNGQQGMFQVTANRALFTNLRTAAGVEIGTATTPIINNTTQWASGALGAMANYGTSPGAVLVPGVNAFVTNTNANGQATMANSSPVVIASNQSNLTVIGAGTAGTANAGVQTVQGIAGMTKLLVTPDSVALPANQSVNVAQVGGTNTVNGGLAGSISVGGTVATNVAITANPLNLGAQAVSAENTAVTTARQVQLVADLVGKLIVLPYSNPENFVSGTVTSAMTGTTSTSLVAAPAAGLRNYITQCTVSNSHATVGTDMILQDGSGGTTLYVIPAAPAFGGATLSFPTPLRQPTTATALFIANVTTGANTKASCSGYKGA